MTTALIEWVQESGDAAADARYLAGLRGMTGGVDLRRRELSRLARIHGEGHRFNVERMLKESWSGAEPATPAAGGRLSPTDALAAMKTKLGIRDDNLRD